MIVLIKHLPNNASVSWRAALEWLQNTKLFESWASSTTRCFVNRQLTWRLSRKTESVPRLGFWKDCFIHVGNRTKFLVARLLRVGYSLERSPERDTFSIFEVLPQAYKFRGGGGRGARLERPADGRQQSTTIADETQTTTATSCRILPYAASLRDKFTGRNSRDEESHKLKKKNPEALITPAERLR